MPETKRNIQAVLTVTCVVSLVAGFALIKIAFGLIALGVVTGALAVLGGRK
jgi:hypothetical protein